MGSRLAVFGTGYLGATHAVCMAHLGHEVVGVDVDADKVARLAGGEVPFYEPGLTELLESTLNSGRLRFVSSYAEAADFADVHFIAVGTPQRSDGLGADLRFVEAVVSQLAPLLDRPAVILGKSTVPVGTAAALSRRLLAGAPAGDAVELAWNPEFLREGCALADTLRPDRIVLGVDRARPGRAEEVTRGVYAPILNEGVPLLITDRETAELAKTAANAFLATKISFINAMAEVCDAAGADVGDLADVIGHDPRIGRRFLNAGIGFGGGCLPKDIRGLIARARELGARSAADLLNEVDTVNNRGRLRVADMARELVGGDFTGITVAVLGAAFKPDCDDVRESPALDIADRIQSQGATVRVYDPKAIATSRQLYPDLDYASSVAQACHDADITLLLTEWEELRTLDPAWLARIVQRRFMIDGRNCLPRREWTEAGWTVRGIGR